MNEEQEINYIALAHFPTSYESGIVAELLQNNGINSIQQGINFGGLEPLLMPGGFSEITLLVPENELERAQQLYDAFFEGEAVDALPEDSDPPDETQ